MEWWNTPDAQYESYLSEGVVKKAAGAFAAYQIGKRAIPKIANWAVDRYHSAKDQAGQLQARANDPQSHTRPDGYRYPAKKKPNPDDGQTVKEGWDDWDGYTVDEFGMPVQEFDVMRAKDVGTNQSGTLIAYGKNKTAWVSDRKAAKYGAGAAAAGAAAYGAYRGVKKLKSMWNNRNKKAQAAPAPEAPKLPPAKPAHVKGSAHGPNGHADYEADGYTRKF
jgi:hypothetical protein